jgi:hypothetical protein
MSLIAVCSLQLRDVNRVQEINDLRIPTMYNPILTAYSSAYSTAMMQNVKPAVYVAVANKSKESRFSALVKLLSRA